jgi:adenosine deaminase
MTTHLHVHLEPNERKRHQIGRSTSSYNNAAQLFAEHTLDNPDRLAVDLDDLELFIKEFHAEQYAQGVCHAELRLSPRRFLSPAVSLQEVLRSADRAVSDLRNPTVRLILLLNRDSPSDFVDECKGAIVNGLPSHFVGVDLAGDEVRFADVGRLEGFFCTARSAGLGVTVHAGEFGGPDNIWRAIDQLGANRIGHAVSAVGCRQLAARLRADRILVEISVSSNVALGAVPVLESHPLPWFVENDIPVCLNTDIPLHLGTNLYMERRAVGLLVKDQRILDEMEAAARHHSFSNSP